MSTINVKLYMYIIGSMLAASRKDEERERERKVENMVSRVAIAAILVAPLAFLGSAQLVHLGDSLPEFVVLAFFIGMSFGLMVMCRVSKTAARKSQRVSLPRTSREGSILLVGSG